MRWLGLMILATLLWVAPASANLFGPEDEGNQLREAIEREILPLFASVESRGLLVYGILDIYTWEHDRNPDIKIWDVQVVLPLCDQYGVCVLTVQSFTFQVMPHLDPRVIAVTEPSRWPQ